MADFIKRRMTLIKEDKIKKREFTVFVCDCRREYVLSDSGVDVEKKKRVKKDAKTL